MALALALQDTGISSLLLEARALPEKVEDPRPLALSHGSYLILRRLGVWSQLIQNTPITTIHISNRGSFGQTILTHEDAGVSTLGFVVNYHGLFHAMHQKLTASKANYIAGAAVTRLDTDENSGTVHLDHQGKETKVTAKLLVLADGGQLAQQVPDISYQTHDYQQWAVVANVQAEKKQTGIAYERFTASGPVASQHRCTLRGTAASVVLRCRITKGASLHDTPLTGTRVNPSFRLAERGDTAFFRR